MSDEKSDFKVKDRRFSAGATDEPETPKKAGDGFVMKDAPEQDAVPQIDFSTLCLSLATGAMIHLGLAPDPGTKKVQKNIEMARQNIDILSLLHEKTKGNLTKEEDQMLGSLLAEIRLRFVEASRR